MKNQIVNLLLVIVLIVLAWSIYHKFNPTVVTVVSERHMEFSTIQNKKVLIDFDKTHFKVHNQQGKIVIFKIFAWDCPYCLKEIPELIKLQEEFPNELEIIALVAKKGTHHENIEMMQKHGINYTIVESGDYEKLFVYLQKNYDWKGVIPASLIMGELGKVLTFKEGVYSYSFAELLKQSLQHKGK